jgi:hypothetical protein
MAIYLSHLREMELKWVVGAQTDIKTCLEEIRQGITFICKKKSIVAQGAHCNANLFEIKQILQRRDFTQ